MKFVKEEEREKYLKEGYIEGGQPWNDVMKEKMKEHTENRKEMIAIYNEKTNVTKFINKQDRALYSNEDWKDGRGGVEKTSGENNVNFGKISIYNKKTNKVLLINKEELPKYQLDEWEQEGKSPTKEIRDKISESSKKPKSPQHRLNIIAGKRKQYLEKLKKIEESYINSVNDYFS